MYSMSMTSERSNLSTIHNTASTSTLSLQNPAAPAFVFCQPNTAGIQPTCDQKLAASAQIIGQPAFQLGLGCCDNTDAILGTVVKGIVVDTLKPLTPGGSGK